MMIHTAQKCSYLREMNHTHQPRRRSSSRPTASASLSSLGKPDGVPLVFNQHFTGSMDHWIPP